MNQQLKINSNELESIIAKAKTQSLSDHEVLQLAKAELSPQLINTAAEIRDQGFHNIITYSRKVFIPLTHLCRDLCHYCTFAQAPKEVKAPYLTLDEVLTIAKQGAELGCKEALFTLGEKPELRYKAAQHALQDMGYESTLEYLKAAGELVFQETGLLPHFNPGTMTAEEITDLRNISPSMGIMLESASSRLCEKDMPHYGSPDKDPSTRLTTIETAGKLKTPLTSGILIGIGETRYERIESLLALRQLHQEHGHIQEIIVQNFRAKADTRMAQAPEPDLSELLWSIAIARLIFGNKMSIQAPPNLSPGVLPQLISAGINDWGGVSPVTPDFVNPEAPWPHLEQLRSETAQSNKYLQERLTVYPRYIRDHYEWIDKKLHQQILHVSDGQGLARVEQWTPGLTITPPEQDVHFINKEPRNTSQDIEALLNKKDFCEQDIVRLFESRGDDFTAICKKADALRQVAIGNTVTYAVNRNINYTNICYFNCQFCAFSKGKTHEDLRGKPYLLDINEIVRRSQEAWDRGATEVCLQGGIHPEYTGQTYLDICRAITSAIPDMHIHAFSPLEIWQGAETLGISLKAFLSQLKEAGLNTLPGTAAEILDDEVRSILCPDKINTEQWLEVMETAHNLGIKTTATIMFGHVDHYKHWARHLLRILELQKKTGGFTEFVPLPFVAEEAPIYRRGKARRGPTFRESILMHAIARIVLNSHIDNIQASWVKMGNDGIQYCLNAGANDLGGTLMNESITRAAGAKHGQENTPNTLRAIITKIDRQAKQRSTLYEDVDDEQQQKALKPQALIDITDISSTIA